MKEILMEELGVWRKGDFAQPNATAHYPADLTLEPVHLDIDLHVDVLGHSASGTVTHTLRANAGDVSSITLNAVDLDIESVTSPDAELTHRYDGRELTVTFAKPLAKGDERKLAIKYRVEKPATGLFFFGPCEKYPKRPIYAATDHETERARHWLPTIDLPNVRPTLDFHLRANADYTILANGALQNEETHDDGTKTVHWHLDHPCPSYLTCFAIGDFVRCDDGEHDGKPIAYFTSKYFTAEDLKRGFGRTGKMLDWMTKKLDSKYPFPKYFQFALPEFGGAMENISLVSWADYFVMTETMAQEMTWITDQVNLHEMAHTWFGDHIVCRDYANAWLKESWAVFIETLWLEDSKGVEEGQYDFYSNCQAYFNEADNSYVRPIATRKFDHSWKMYDRHLYPGGAARLHMLRHDLGEDVFLAATRDYVKTFGNRTVETDDFRKIMEEHSGRSLGKWFDQWIFGKGYPKLKCSYSHDKDKGEFTISIEQTQVDKKKGVGLFDFTTEVGWFIDGKMHTQTLRIHERKHSVVVKVEGEPEIVRIDPKARSVCGIEFNPGDEMLRKQLTDSEDVIGRILAANELAKTGKRKNVAAVLDHYKNEKFWGVRVRMVQALGKAGTQSAVEALAEIVGYETDGMVCESALRALGEYRDPLVIEAAEKFLDSGPNLHRARGAAYDILGAQRGNAPLDRLLEAAKTPSAYGWEQSGALRALAGSRNKDALPTIEAALKYGADDRARPAAAMSLGAAAKMQDDATQAHATEVLVDHLRDPIGRVQKAAATGLVRLGATSAIGKLHAFKATVSDQEATDIDAQIRAIRASAKPKAKADEKEMDKLRDKLRKLEDRLEKLEASND